MTVLPWLLLYATVIQLGQSNYSILSEDGTYEVNSYANNTIPYNDRSQIRRTRRSVDSDLEDAQKALDKAGAARKIVEEDRQKVDTTLIELQGNLTKAKKLAEEKKDVYETAVNAENDLEDALQKAIAAVKPATDAFKDAKKKYEEKMKDYKKKDEARNDYEGKTVNKTIEDQTKAKEELKKATDLVSEMNGLRTKYDAEKATKKKYMDDIQLYEDKEKLVADIKTANENIKNKQLKENLEKAERVKASKEKEKNDIENNEILNGVIPEDFGDLKLENVEYKKNGDIKKWQTELDKKPKDSPEAATLQQEIDKANNVLKFIEHLYTIDKTNKDKKVVDLKNGYEAMKTVAQAAVTKAIDEVTKAKGELDIEENKITAAEAGLVNVDIDALKKTKEKADGEMTQVDANIKKYTNDLDTFSTANGGKKGEAEWDKLKTALDGAVTAKTQALNAANQAVTNAQNTYKPMKEDVENMLKAINKEEKKVMDDMKTAETDAVNAEGAARTKKENYKTYFETSKKEYESTRDRVTELEREIEEANTTLIAKQGEEYNAMRAQEEASKALKTAQDKKAEADKQAEEAKKQAEEAAAEARRKDQEHQEQVRALGLGFGVTAGIVVIGAAVGLSVFFVMRRRRKQKKEAAAKVPKREEIDAPNGLTIIRREGMQDKYVIKGDDFNFRGPLVRGRVHNEVPTKHMLDDQVGGDKIENIFFDKKLNDAYLIGEGVEIIEEDSVSVSEGKKTARIDPVELLANMSAEDMAGSSQKYIKDTDAKAAPPGGDKKSSKSKRAQTATPKKAGGPSDGEKAPLLGENKKA